MITIGIDESGNFEEKNYIKKFVGGFVYTGDYEEEKINLENFFKEQCRRCNIPYPAGIHSTEMRFGSFVNIKQTIKENLIKYIKEKNEKNDGKYYFICMLKSKNHRKDYSNLSNIIDDEKASNLYEHMVCQLINNTLFHYINFSNPTNVNLEIATRSIPVVDSEKIEEFKALGYAWCKRSGKTIFYLTDQKTFKAAISTKIMDSKIKNKLNFKMNVQSVNYRNREKEPTIYLYLADFACDVMKEFFNMSKDDFDIENSFKIVKEKIGKNFLCWVYDDIDGIYNRIVQNFYEKDIISCLNNIYSIEQSNFKYKSYYMKIWIKPIEAKLIEIFDINKMDIYIEEIEYLFSKENPEYEKAKYFIDIIYDILKENCDNQGKVCKNYNVYKYRFCDMLIRIYNHRGDIENSKKYYECCEKYKAEVDIEEYMATLNRVVEIDANSFDFKTAVEKLQNSLMALDLWKETKEEAAELMGVGKKRTTCLVLRGKTLSSLGQFYAFMRNEERSLEYFSQALQEFTNSLEHRNVTLSYIMHLALDSNNFHLYKKYENQYFGSEDIKEQFNILMEGNNVSSKDYKFYVYMKALNIFYCTDVDKDLLDKIQNTEYTLKKFKVNSHPWELIYKHMAELQYKNGNINEADNIIEKAVNTVKNADITIKLINVSTKIKYDLLKNSHTDKILKDIRDFKNLNFNASIKKHFSTSIESAENIFKKNKIKDEEIIKAAEDILKGFTYMYC